MSIEKCLLAKVKANKLTKKQAEELTADLRRMQEGNLDGASAGDAEALAAKTLHETKTAEFERQKMLLVKAAIAQENVKKIMGSTDDIIEGFMSQLDISVDGKNNHIVNVTGVEEEVAAVAWSFLGDAAYNFRSRVPGTFSGNHKMHGDLVRAMHGEKPLHYPEVVEYAKSWAEAAEYLRGRYNQAGGNIAHRADWGMTHKHSPELFQAHFKSTWDELVTSTTRSKGVSKKAHKKSLMIKAQDVASTRWAEEILPELDRTKLLDLDTEKPLNNAQSVKMLKETYLRIYTDGLYDQIPGVQTKGKKLANMRQEKRVLPFKDANSWMRYSGKYSNVNPYQAMIEHIQGMSKDIALMETLGPSPSATLKMAQDVVAKSKAVEGKDAKLATANMELLFDTITGKANIPIRPKTAAYFDDVANVLSGAQLGAASIPAFFGDAGTSKVARRIHGLPHWNFVKALVKDVAASGDLSIAQAARIGLAPELFFQDAMSTVRFVGDLKGHEWSRRVPNAVFRLTQLSRITQGRSNAFALDLLGHLHDVRGLKYSELNINLRNMMDNFGVDEDVWNLVRKAGVEKVRGAEVLDMAGMSKAAKTPEARDAASRLFQWVKHGEKMAVPTSTARARAVKGAVGPKGTIRRFASDSFWMYKTFPMTYMHTHMRNLGGTQKSKLGTAALYGELFLLMTMGGAVSLQVKAVLSGRDPLPMLDENGFPSLKFIGAAILQGGSFGLFGDFIFSDQNRYGKSLKEQLVGPAVSAASDLSKLTVGNLTQLAQGEDTKIVAEGRQFLERNILPKPFYLKLLQERLILDRLEEYLDPEAASRFQRKERSAHRNNNQGYWFAPGDKLDEVRKPDLSNLSNAQ